VIERQQSNGLTLLQFPPSYLSLYVDSIGGDQAQPHSGDEVIAITGADAALDGPMFSNCNPGDSYAASDCGVVGYRHLDLGSGVNIPSSYVSRGLTISIVGGQAIAMDGDSVAPGAQVAVQLYPSLVEGGRSKEGNTSDVASRAALAIMSDGRLSFVTSAPMTLADFASRLVQAGAISAGYTDGGGSTSLVTPDNYTGSSEHRRVVTWLLAKANSSAGVLVPLGLLLAGGAAWYWWKHRRHT
jgi:uncharacterized Zn-binding protein involved in type VI secretion